ncbi:MAG: ParB N-terminal domain-containing protein [Thermoguttaceae bacterium]|nr:ParB N-terminal domain-containing protein [Thermoguttaceae bacterium]
MKVEMWKLKRIKPYDRNPRHNDEAVDAVALSIQEFGFRQPIVVDASGVIVVGHTRWKAAKKLKLDVVPVTVMTDVSEAKIKAYRLADNKVHEASEWNFELLGEELDALRNDLDFSLDMSLFGFEAQTEESQEDEPTTEKEIMIPELFQVVIECNNEEDQRQCYEELTAAGRACRCVNL